jgi:hypothetical protein
MKPATMADTNRHGCGCRAAGRTGGHTVGMSGQVVGQAVNAVLAPPQAERFAAVAGVDLGRLALNVTGWNKLVLLDCDRVFLFPRSAIGVEWFERELAAYRALAMTQLDVVPRLLGCWEDPDIYPFPFAAVTRLRGQVPTEPEALIEQLGQVIACWHELEPPPLPGRAHLVTSTPLIIAGCDGPWTRPPAPTRPLRPPAAWTGPAAPRSGRTCWPAPHSSRRCWSTATFIKTSCWPKAAS